MVLRSEPPTLITEEEVDEYFRKRGTVVLMTYIPTIAYEKGGYDTFLKQPRAHQKVLHGPQAKSSNAR